MKGKPHLMAVLVATGEVAVAGCGGSSSGSGQSSTPGDSAASSASGQLVPDIASSVSTSNGGRTWTFHVRKVAVMHNGKIFEQADSDELFANPKDPYTQQLLSAVSSLEV